MRSRNRRASWASTRRRSMSRGFSTRVLDRLRRDLVEDHALHRHRVRRVQHLEQVPGDGLALAILIGGEIQLGGVLELRLELADDVLLVVRHDVEGLEVVLDVEAEDLPRAACRPRGRPPPGAADRGCGPTEASTSGVPCEPFEPARKRWIVFALAGDSTMTSGLAIAERLRAGRGPCQLRHTPTRDRPDPRPLPARWPDQRRDARRGAPVGPLRGARGRPPTARSSASP